MMTVERMLSKPEFSREDLVHLLQTRNEEKISLFNKAADIRKAFVEDKVYFRGLIEFSNVCQKNCFYCGIRRDNHLKMKRFFMQPGLRMRTTLVLLYCNQAKTTVLHLLAG
jgi:biotin synthase